MRELAERTYFHLARGLGRLLRAGGYSNVRIVDRDGHLEVRKRRSFYAPLLVTLGDPLVRILDTGMRVLAQGEWEAREWLMYERLYGTSVRIEADGTLVLPHLPGRTLAAVLEDPASGESARRKAVELAVAALADFHAKGFTHSDAMAENVMVDLEAGVARWFDFETAHDPSRPAPWRRADDLRALLATSLLRTSPEDFAETLQLVADVYSDDSIVRLVAASFTWPLQRRLAFHLGQAGLSFQSYRTIARVLNAQ